MKGKWKARLAMGLFLLVCLIPSAGMLLSPSALPAANQVLAAPPRLTQADGRFNFAVLQDLTDYLSDHLALRQQMITASAYLDGAVFGVSREEKVTLGREDWLFYTQTLSDYLNTEPMTDRQLWSAARTMALLEEYAQSQGAQVFVTIAPNKASLYPWYLPQVGTPLAGESNAVRLARQLEAQDVTYLDLFTPFRDRPETLYYATDSHWTTPGAALAADVLNAGMGKSTDFFSGDFSTASEGHRGDLYEMLYPAGTYREPLLEPEGMCFDYTRTFHSPEDQRIETENPAQSGTLLAFRDSFGNSLYPFLAQSWQRALFSRSVPFQLSLLDDIKADTVLVELVERNLDYLVTRPAAFPAPERRIDVLPVAGILTARGVWSDDGALPGSMKLSGTLSGTVDTDSPLYLRYGDRLWEATPGGSWQEGDIPFTLYLANDTMLYEDLEILYVLNGVLETAELNLE